MTDSPDTLTPSQTRAVRLALDAGRYRNERDALRNQLAEADRERLVLRDQLEQARRILGDLLLETRAADPDNPLPPGIWRCDDLGACSCSVARSWRVLNGFPEVIS